MPNLDRTTAMFYDCNCLEQNKVNLGGLNFSKTRFVGMMFFLEKDSYDDYISEGQVDSLIKQCKDRGWKGYADGRADDFDTPLSKPREYYKDELEKVKAKRARKQNRITNLVDGNTLKIVQEALGF